MMVFDLLILKSFSLEVPAVLDPGLQIEESSKPVSWTKQLDKAVTTNYKPVANHQYNIEYEKKKKEDGKRARAEKQQVLDMLFSAFEKHQYYNIKDLVDITKQPVLRKDSGVEWAANVPETCGQGDQAAGCEKSALSGRGSQALDVAQSCWSATHFCCTLVMDRAAGPQASSPSHASKPSCPGNWEISLPGEACGWRVVPAWATAGRTMRTSLRCSGFMAELEVNAALWADGIVEAALPTEFRPCAHRMRGPACDICPP
ncbi:UNVERIFIED_CONTAM: hypothetical protein K2H54_008026 [Gekko kuhli]